MHTVLGKILTRNSGARRAAASRHGAARLACCALFLCLAVGGAAAQYRARITQEDYSHMPRVRVYVSVADDAGNPIPDDQSVKLDLYENGSLVSESVLSQGYEVYSVLVLDVSGSMKKGGKLDQAKAAAINYVIMAPPSFRIAVVGFANNAFEVARFTNDKSYLRSRISTLTIMGETALQDGIATGLDMLKDQKGRKSVVALTDGFENHSHGLYAGKQGQSRLMARASNEYVTISTIGLGDVDGDYLMAYEQTGGKYLYSPTPGKLSDVFGKAVKLLEKERVLEYVTPNPDLDGTHRNLNVQLTVNNKTTETQGAYVVPGFLPHVHGQPLPFALLIAALLMVPSALSFTRSMFGVYSFRVKHVKRLAPDSAFIDRMDWNYRADGTRFAAGDLIVVCPVSKTPYFVRSWRMMKCKCERGDQNCAGHFCYQRNFPQWVRRSLDKLSGKQVGPAGRRWLCNCAGDKDGR